MWLVLSRKPQVQSPKAGAFPGSETRFVFIKWGSQDASPQPRGQCSQLDGQGHLCPCPQKALGTVVLGQAKENEHLFSSS